MKVCKICGSNAHGTHFGVVSCRACAAFFRRNAFSRWSGMKCQKKVKSENSKNSCLCRPCRLKLCRKMGMATEKFQLNRDGIGFVNRSHLPLLPSIESFVGRPNFIIFCDPSTPVPSPKVFIHLHSLLQEGFRLLDQGCESPVFAENSLKRLTSAFKYIKFSGENLQHYERVGKLEFLEIIEFYFMKVTKWILHFDEVHKLEKQVQMLLVKSIWHVWCGVHKLVTTAAFRRSGKAKATQKILRNICMDPDRVKTILDTSWMSDYPSDFVTRYMSSQNQYDFEIIELIEKLNPSETELTFMFAQVCFEYVGKRYQGDILKLTDRFQLILSNDLHNYYTIEERRPRYFHRLSELMKVNNIIQKSIWETRSRREIGRVFNVLKIEYSHPEMFEDSGFY